MTFHKMANQINNQDVLNTYQLNEQQKAFKAHRDEELKHLLTGQDNRLLVIIGPCSAHDEESVMTYVSRLAEVQKKVADQLFIIPRVYTNKPRTNGDGYKGLLHQPDSQRGVDLMKGIEAVRRLHHRVITEVGLTTADEMLYPENLKYVEDLLSYIAIGARSVEDQQHRFVASGMAQAVGMKNPTSGNLNVMFHSVYAAQQSQRFIYNDYEVETSGNSQAHVVLRGGLDEHSCIVPNYHYEDLLKVCQMYQEQKLQTPFVVVDTNHDNSGKQFEQQTRIVMEVLNSRQWHPLIQQNVRGFMIESFLEDGRANEEQALFGQSITDPCIGWEKTEKLLYQMAETV